MRQRNKNLKILKEANVYNEKMEHKNKKLHD
jgi:hypothetical protein